jgi:ribosomal protein L31E
MLSIRPILRKQEFAVATKFIQRKTEQGKVIFISRQISESVWEKENP